MIAPRVCVVAAGMLCAPAVVGYTPVSSYSELAAAVANQAQHIELVDSFSFSGDIDIGYSCEIRPGQDIVLDLNGFVFKLRDGSFTVGAADYSTTFTNGRHGLQIWSFQETDAVLRNCRFDYAAEIGSPPAATNGLHLRPAYRGMTVVCENCSANYNVNDGFNVANAATGTPLTVLTLVNCEAIGNDRLGLGTPAGDGVTAHNPNQLVNVQGGTYALNGKSGAAFVWGAELHVSGDAEFYGNGWSLWDLSDVYSADGHVEWIGGATPRLRLSNATCNYRGGSIDAVTLEGGELHIYGFGFWQQAGVVGGTLGCWEPFETEASAYIEHVIPIPGDGDGDGDLDADDALLFMDQPGDLTCDGPLLLQDARILQLEMGHWR